MAPSASSIGEQLAVDRLPRGRHGLSREQVTGSQRERLLRAMGEAVAEHGYVKTSVAEVLRRAGVSRETFYEHYPNKETCFLAAYDAAVARVLEAIGGRPTSEAGRPDDPLGLVDGMVARYLAVLAAEPAIARTFLIEVYGAGPAALDRRVEVQRRFAAGVADQLGARTDAQRFACELVVAGTGALVTQRLCAGEGDRLAELHGPLMVQVRTLLSESGLL